MMLTGKMIMILGAGILQLPAIEKAVEMKLKVVALDMNRDAVGFRVPGVIREVISTTDISAAIEAAKRYQIDGVMTLATDMPMRTVAAVAKECGVVGISEDTAVKATDKSVMRQTLKDYGVPVPAFHRVAGIDEYFEAVRTFNTPFIIKPADSSGSRGIYLIKNWGNREIVRNAYDYARKYSHNGIVVVEEYMAGPEVSVETLAAAGDVRVIQITDKITAGAPHFVEMGHTQPTRLGKETAEVIRKIAIAANHAIGIENGPSHTEIIVTADGPKIVELGARLGGDCITTHLVPLSTGINMVEACICIALGENPDITAKFSRGSAIRYFHQTAGIVRRIEGLDTVGSMPGIKQISIVHGVGEKITEIDSSGARMGFIIAQGEDADDASKKCKAALNAIHIEIEGTE